MGTLFKEILIIFFIGISVIVSLYLSNFMDCNKYNEVDVCHSQQLHILSSLVEELRVYGSCGNNFNILIKQLIKKNGENFFKCPIHHVNYVVNGDCDMWDKIWESSFDPNIILIYCPLPHDDPIVGSVYLEVSFEKIMRSDSKPKIDIQAVIPDEN